MLSLLLEASPLVPPLTHAPLHAAQTMHKGVERDEARQAEKRKQRALDLEMNQEREKRFQEMQPTVGHLAGDKGGAAATR